jgi:hypothetical protein
MSIELLVRGYPSRVRFAEWQAANSLPEAELEGLSKEQRALAQKLHVPEKAYAVALKAAELSHARAAEQMEVIAKLIAEEVKARDSQDELKTVIWDFSSHEFKFVTREVVGKNGKEVTNTLPTEVVDDFLLEKRGSDRRLKDAVKIALDLA